MWGRFKEDSPAILACFCFFFFANNYAVAQNRKSPLQFGCMQQLGIAFEADRQLPTISISNGIRWNEGKCYTGLGVIYEFSSSYSYGQNLPDMLPSFVDARYYFFKKKWLFGMANGGLNFAITNNNDYRNTEYFRESYKNGIYGSLGAGVKAR